MNTQKDIRARLAQTDDVAIVTLEFPMSGEILQVSGSSKRAPCDRPNDAVGEWLALSRALQAAADLFKQAAEEEEAANDRWTTSWWLEALGLR